MINQANSFKHFLYRFTTILVIVFILLSCEPFNTTTTGMEDPSALPLTSTTLVTKGSQPVLPAVPAIYQSPYLDPIDTPHTYIEDTCRYLRNRWHPLNAEPGTVVMIIMFHEISNGPVQTLDGVNVGELHKIMEQLKAQGFEAINTRQFLFFMERNVKIPPRSVLIIQDGSYNKTNFDKFFREFWENWKWPVVNGWRSQPDLPDSLWEENALLEYEGWVDHQAQGVIEGTILSDDSSKAVIIRELEGSLKAFADHFGKTPVAFIWPNGGFGMRPAEAARQLGYQIGFTANSRGPVMYNWVPLADEIDPERPTYIPDGPVNDPLMTLPRYWPYQALNAVDEVRVTGEEAAAYAQANKALEFEYYEAVCRPTYGPIPT